MSADQFYDIESETTFIDSMPRKRFDSEAST